jgi:hexosaminidase
VFCPKESTITFLQDVLTEVMDLFPGEYIHIGGDECPKTRWKSCANCQALMKKENLKSAEELQSYFIRRMDKFVTGKGRKIIGWDEILEGGLAPNAAVMSWRGTEGGTAAAQQKHDVVMCPGSHCYLDHYQGDPAHEPLAIGGFTTVQKAYSYEPVPEGLTPEEATHILGVQGNVWTEYILTPEHVEYMAAPRMLALAEVGWSPREKRDEGSFIRRLEEEFAPLDALHVNYSKSLYNVEFRMSGSKKRGQVNVDLTCAPGLGEMRYTSDGSEPTQASPKFDYTIEQRGNATIKAAIFGGEKKLGNTTSLKLDFNKATGCALTVEPRPDERYDDGGIFALVDGVSAGEKPRMARLADVQSDRYGGSRKSSNLDACQHRRAGGAYFLDPRAQERCHLHQHRQPELH